MNPLNPPNLAWARGYVVQSVVPASVGTMVLMIDTRTLDGPRSEVTLGLRRGFSADNDSSAFFAEHTSLLWLWTVAAAFLAAK